MSLETQRVFHYDGSEFTDYSRELSDINANTVLPTLTSSEYLYIASDLPFNNRWFDVTAGSFDAVAEIVTVTITGNGNSLSGSGNGKHFQVTNQAGDNYYWWFDVTGDLTTQTDPNLADSTGATVTVGFADTSSQIASALATAIDGSGGNDYSATADGAVVTMVADTVGAITQSIINGGVSNLSLSVTTTGVDQIASANPSVEIWDGSAWQAAVDIVDATQTSNGIPLEQSGVLRWAVDRNKQWARESTTEDITALSTLRVYNMYWARVSVGATYPADHALNYIGYKFATNSDLYDEYPELQRSTVLAAFETGKTDWDEQLVLASEKVVRWLKQQRRIFNSNQILDHQQFRTATVHKCAEMIYYSMSGEDMDKKRAQASKYYREAVDEAIAFIDRDLDGRLDPVEKQPYQTVLVRR